MKIMVQKFGGTSVATEDSREHVYKKIEEAVRGGYSLVVVVSAMGRNGDPYATDTLLNLIRKDIPFASKRELDVIFSCGENIAGAIVASNLQKRGYKSVYLTGEQARIITDENFSDARIRRVETDKIKSLLDIGNIVVVGGGQGVSENGDITTLGRGGSDTTGCALGVAIHANEIHIYTDVEGIMTADPRKVKEAVLLEKISYEDCCNMANKGAKVIHPRAVEIAMKNPESKLYVKSTFSTNPGTLICEDDENLEDVNTTGVAGQDNLVYCRVVSNEYKSYDKLQEIMGCPALHDSKVYYGIDGIVFVSDSKIFAAAEKMFNDNGFKLIKCENVSEVSIIGSNFMKYPELCQEIRDKIQKSGIDIKMSMEEDKSVSYVISEEHYICTMNLLHEFVVNKTAGIIN